MNFDPTACRTAAEAPAAVAALLAAAAAERAGDVHLLPEPDGLAVRFRVDGRLTDRGRFPGRSRRTSWGGSRCSPGC